MDDRDISGKEASYETARTLFVGIASSPLLLAAVMWFFVGSGEPSGPPDFTAWAVFGLFGGGGLVGWVLFRSKAVTPMTEWSRRKRSAEGFTAAMLQSRLVGAWASAEGVGFAGVIAYFFLAGSLTMLVTALAASIVCFGLSAPRKAWYRTLQREAGGAATA